MLKSIMLILDCGRFVLELVHQRENMAQVKKHGGAREGAGRKSKNPNKTRAINLKLDEETIRLASELGAGDISYGVYLKFKQ